MLIALARATTHMKIEKEKNYLTLFSAHSLAITH